MTGPVSQFLGARPIIADISNTLVGSVFIALGCLFVLFLFRTLLRKEWAAAIAFVLFFLVFVAVGSESVLVVLVRNLILNGLTVFLLRRLGLLALVAAFAFQGFLDSFPLTILGSAWYGGISLAGILVMAAMTFYGFYTSLGGRPVFGSAVRE
jgi:hypothetical protein